MKKPKSKELGAYIAEQMLVLKGNVKKKKKFEILKKPW